MNAASWIAIAAATFFPMIFALAFFFGPKRTKDSDAQD